MASYAENVSIWWRHHITHLCPHFKCSLAKPSVFMGKFGCHIYHQRSNFLLIDAVYKFMHIYRMTPALYMEMNYNVLMHRKVWLFVLLKIHSDQVVLPQNCILFIPRDCSKQNWDNRLCVSCKVNLSEKVICLLCFTTKSEYNLSLLVFTTSSNILFGTFSDRWRWHFYSTFSSIFSSLNNIKFQVKIASLV